MFLTYFVLWIIFNGRFTLEIGLFGLAIAGALLAFPVNLWTTAWRRN